LLADRHVLQDEARSAGVRPLQLGEVARMRLDQDPIPAKARDPLVQLIAAAAVVCADLYEVGI
jgi:hypothetical protein